MIERLRQIYKDGVIVRSAYTEEKFSVSGELKQVEHGFIPNNSKKYIYYKEKYAKVLSFCKEDTVVVECVTQEQWNFACDKYEKAKFVKEEFSSREFTCFKFKGLEEKNFSGWNSKSYFESMANSYKVLFLTFEEWLQITGYTFYIKEVEASIEVPKTEKHKKTFINLIRFEEFLKNEATEEEFLEVQAYKKANNNSCSTNPHNFIIEHYTCIGKACSSCILYDTDSMQTFYQEKFQKKNVSIPVEKLKYPMFVKLNKEKYLKLKKFVNLSSLREDSEDYYLIGGVGASSSCYKGESATGEYKEILFEDIIFPKEDSLFEKSFTIKCKSYEESVLCKSWCKENGRACDDSLSFVSTSWCYFNFSPEKGGVINKNLQEYTLISISELDIKNTSENTSTESSQEIKGQLFEYENTSEKFFEKEEKPKTLFLQIPKI